MIKCILGLGTTGDLAKKEKKLEAKIKILSKQESSEL